MAADSHWVTIIQTPAPIVKLVGLAPTPGHAEAEAKPNAEPNAKRAMVSAMAATVPAIMADQERADPPDPAVTPAGYRVGSTALYVSSAMISARTAGEER
jgi:hypothetical protein